MNPFKLLCAAGVVGVASMSLLSVASAADMHRDEYAVQAHFHLPGNERWDYVAFEPTRQRLFISRETHVQVVDANDGHLIGQIEHTDGVHGFAFVEDRKLGFITNGRANTITVINLDTLATVDTIQAGGADPDGILYIHAPDRLVVSNGHDQSVSIIDVASRKVMTTIPVGGKPEAIAADDSGHVFVNIEDKGEIVEIDAKQGAVLAHWAIAPCEEPTGLAIDTASARLFSVCSNHKMMVVDSTTGRIVAQLPIGGHPDTAVFDPDLKLALSSNGESGTLTSVHEEDPDHYRVVQNVTTIKGAKTMALDTGSHRVYLVSSRFGPAVHTGSQSTGSQSTDSHVKPSVTPGTFEVVVVGRR